MGNGIIRNARLHLKASFKGQGSLPAVLSRVVYQYMYELGVHGR